MDMDCFDWFMSHVMPTVLIVLVVLALILLGVMLGLGSAMFLLLIFGMVA